MTEEILRIKVSELTTIRVGEGDTVTERSVASIAARANDYDQPSNPDRAISMLAAALRYLSHSECRQQVEFQIPVHRNRK